MQFLIHCPSPEHKDTHASAVVHIQLAHSMWQCMACTRNGPLSDKATHALNAAYHNPDLRIEQGQLQEAFERIIAEDLNGAHDEIVEPASESEYVRDDAIIESVIAAGHAMYEEVNEANNAVISVPNPADGQFYIEAIQKMWDSFPLKLEFKPGIAASDLIEPDQIIANLTHMLMRSMDTDRMASIGRGRQINEILANYKDKVRLAAMEIAETEGEAETVNPADAPRTAAPEAIQISVQDLPVYVAPEVDSISGKTRKQLHDEAKVSELPEPLDGTIEAD